MAIYIPHFSEIMEVARGRGCDGESQNQWQHLRFWAPMQEGGGTVAFDASGWNEDTDLSGTSWAIGPRGRYLDFSSGDYGRASGCNPLPANSDYTIMLRIKPTDADQYRVLVGDDLATGGGGWALTTYDSPASSLLAYHQNSYIISETCLSDNVWQDVAITWEDATDTLKFYVDGEEVAVDTDWVLGALSLGTSSNDLHFGIDPRDRAGQEFVGGMMNCVILDEVSYPAVKQYHADPWAMARQRRRSYAAVLTISGSVTWGHDTGVTETNIRDFSGNWTGTGSVSGSGDAEIISLDSGEYMESEVVQISSGKTVRLRQNVYDGTGDDVTLKYRTGATSAACQAAEWSAYSTPFGSLGYVQVRVEATA